MKRAPRIEFDQLAPDLVLSDTTGKPIQLSNLWKQKPLLLSFTRHFGCTQCKEMLEQIREGKEQIHKAGLEIAIIMQASPEATTVFAEQFAPGLLCLADPERKAYHAFGLERGDLFQTFINPKVWRAVAKSQKKGAKVEPPPAGQDAMQMSGTFIIGTNGKILLPYYYDNIADHPSLDLLLEGVLATGWDKPFNGPIGPAAR